MPPLLREIRLSRCGTSLEFVKLEGITGCFQVRQVAPELAGGCFPKSESGVAILYQCGTE
jgi:hypothetical protein